MKSLAVKTIIKIISIFALVLMILAAILFFNDKTDIDNTRKIIAIGTILWFISAPYWMDRKASA